MRFARSRRFVQALICGFAFALVAALYLLQESGRFGRTLLRWELRYQDLVTSNGRFAQPDNRLVFLAIDSASTSISQLDLQTLFAGVAPDSMEARALETMAGGWPWPRSIYALITDRLLEAGARGVVFDLLFPKPGLGDDVFRDAIERHAGRIALGSNFVSEPMGAGRDAWRLSLPTNTIVPDDAASCVGYVNFWPDFDGVVRRVYYRSTLEQLEGAAPPGHITAEVPSALAARGAAIAGTAELESPFQPRLIRFAGPPGTFVPLPVYQIFVPQYWERNFASGAAFRDKIVLIGPAGNWVHDEHATAFGQMPGPELQLSSINALLHRAFLTQWPHWSSLLLIFGGAIIAWLLTLALANAWLRLGSILLEIAGWLFAVKLAHDHADTVLLAIPPVLSLGLGGVGAFVYDYTRETVERLRVRRTLEAYVSTDVVREVIENPASYLNALGGVRREVALLMTDLRGFTTITESMDSTQLVAQLNEYLSAMIEDIFTVRGSVDKFIGDAILAVWGHLNSAGPEQDAANAIEAFLRMRASLQRLNAEWKTRGMPPLAMGCGVNFGEVVFGNIGSARKRELTVIGDPVNVTARLEGLTKEYGREILIGPAVAELVRERYRVQFIDRLAVKGKTQALDLYSIVNRIDEPLDDAQRSYLDFYERALAASRESEFENAAAMFQQCLAQQPGDKVAALHAARCLTQAKSLVTPLG